MTMGADPAASDVVIVGRCLINSPDPDRIHPAHNAQLLSLDEDKPASPQKFVQKRFRGTQIWCLKPLGEAIVDLCEKLPRLAAATLGHA
jgi:hypothetical protein